ncbi:hypothetical protein Tco_1491904, partial [Tanacetum coccineum]
HAGKTNVLSAEKISVLSCYFPVRYSNHIGEEISCHLWRQTSSLLNANCKKALNLLKKGLLIQGEAKTTSKRRVSRRTTDTFKDGDGDTVFQQNQDLASLEYSQETEGPYCTALPTPDDICRLLKLERVVVDSTIKSQTVSLNPNQILTKELSPDMKQWEELIRENVFGLGGHRDRLPACLAHMLYCVVAEEQYNLAYFFVKRIECARATPTANLPYGMFLTRLYRHVMETYPHLDNGIYDIVERVMRPLALKQTRRPRSDRGKARHSISSSSSHHQGTSSHQHDDDDDDVETSRASTPSPTTYLNSLNPLNYQNYQMPSSSEQTDETLFERQTTLLNQTQQMHKEMRGGFKSFGKALKGVFSKKKNAPNAPSKTPSTKDTSLSSIDYIPKSPTSSTSISPNGYLNPPTSPPSRVSPPLPTQENESMDITLTLSLITPLDVQFDTPSPSPPIFGHHIPWNLLEAHGRAEESVEKGDRKRARFWGSRISSGRKKSWGSNSGDGGNTGDGGKIVGGAIGARGDGIVNSLLVALYACITFLIGYLGKCEMVARLQDLLNIASEEQKNGVSDKAGVIV